MSKASKWARRGREVMRFSERLTRYHRRRKWVPFVAIVGPQGQLLLDVKQHSDGQSLRPSEAVRFAHWILDTFEEKP
jgi:hypothetical protein